MAALAGLTLAGCGGAAPQPATDAPLSSLRPPAAIALDTGWRSVPDPENVGLSDGWSQGLPSRGDASTVDVPNDFNPNVSRAADRGAVVWYALRFTGPAAIAERSWSVRFEQVRRRAEVWLNGRRIGGSAEPYAPFSVRATSLRYGAPNLLVVRVTNVAGPGSFPQDWWNWGGIVRGVSLQPVGRLALEDLGVMPRLGCGYRCGSLLVEGTLRNVSGERLPAGIVVGVRSPSGAEVGAGVVRRSVQAGASVPISFTVALRGHLALWSPSDPALYGVEVQTVSGNRVEQANSLRVGLRSIKVSRGILYLNGHRLWLHGAAIHEDVIGRGAALSDGDIDTIVSQLRSVGANITRAHYLLSDQLLGELDAAGIMVWSQPPVDHADALLAGARGRKRALAMLRATILGERSHPSVVVDSVANELTPTPNTTPGTERYLRQAIGLAHRLDPAAVVGLDTYCYPGFPAQRIYSRLDVLGIDDYFGWYTGLLGHSVANFDEFAPFLRLSHARYPRQALVVSEFGAEALYDGPAAVKGTFEFQSDYLRRTYAVLGGLPFMNGSIYWALRDFAVRPGWTGGTALPLGYPTDGLNHKGLIAYDGTEKPAFAVAASLFGQIPAFAR
ncbi:MAG: glycoside hydrolase family 2 protein [Solirubrobacteraceae bacterium]